MGTELRDCKYLITELHRGGLGYSNNNDNTKSNKNYTKKLNIATENKI